MLKKTPIRLIVGLALALSFPVSAHAGFAPAPAADAYPTISFAYPIIDQKIVDALAEPSLNQRITMTPYIYEGGNDLPVNDDAVELRGYHLFYVSQNNPNDVLDLNDPELNRLVEGLGNVGILIVWDGDSESFESGNNSNFGFLVSPPSDSGVPPLLRSDLTDINCEDEILAFAQLANLGSLQEWIYFVDNTLEQSGFRSNSRYLDFHRQIGTYETYEGEPFVHPLTQFSPLVDSYFRVYRTGSYYGMPETISSTPIRQTTNLSFEQSFYGSDYLSDPTGEVSKIIKEINLKYGNLIIS